MNKDTKIKELEKRITKLEKLLNTPIPEEFGRTQIEDILLRLKNLEGASPI